MAYKDKEKAAREAQRRRVKVYLETRRKLIETRAKAKAAQLRRDYGITYEQCCFLLDLERRRPGTA